MCHVVGTFVSGTYMVIMFEMDVAVVCVFWHIFVAILDLFTHIEWGQCDLFTMWGIFVQWYIAITWNVVCKYVCSASGHMVDVSHFICVTYMDMHLPSMPLKDMQLFLAQHNAPFSTWSWKKENKSSCHLITAYQILMCNLSDNCHDVLILLTPQYWHHIVITGIITIVAGLLASAESKKRLSFDNCLSDFDEWLEIAVINSTMV